MYKRILVPVDLHHIEKLDKALGIAARTAKEHDATVIYVGIVDSVPTTTAKTEKDYAEEALENFAAEQAARHGIKVSDHIALRRDLHLNVGSELVQAAKDTGSDLVVMASHVPGILDHVLSSNAGYVASHAPVSVYVVR